MRLQKSRRARKQIAVYLQYILFFFFKLYIIVLVLPNIKMNPPQVYMCSPSWTLLPPPSPFNPSGSSQCTSPKHPVSCIEPGLATRFIHDILHVSMPFSQIFPPSQYILVPRIISWDWIVLRERRWLKTVLLKYNWYTLSVTF